MIAVHTACNILTLFIVIATSRPLNKKIRLLSVRGSNNYCGSASAVRTPVLHLQSHGTVTLLTNEPWLFDSQPESHRHLWRFWGFSLHFFVVHFLAKRYILQQKCLKGRTGTCVLVQLLAAYTNPESHSAQHHRQTDGRTDRQQDDANSRSYCVTVRLAKNWSVV